MKNALAAFLLLTALLLAETGRAGTVTTTADDGPGSLRDTIANAAAGETIDFSVTGLITLTSGELMIDKSLNITGPGSDTLMIQRSLAPGTPDFRIFDILGGTVIISGMTDRKSTRLNSSHTVISYAVF